MKSLFNIPGVDEKEIILMVRKHWITAVLSIVYGLFSLVVFIFLLRYLALIQVGIFAWRLTIVILTIYLLVTLLYIFNDIVKYYYDVLVLTKEKIIKVDQKNLISRLIFEIESKKVLNVSSVYPTFIHALFKFGNTVIELEHETITFFFVPNPVRISKAIAEINKMKKELGLKPGNNVTEFSTKEDEMVAISGLEKIDKKDQGEGKTTEDLLKAQTELAAKELLKQRSSTNKKPKSWIEIIFEEIFGRF
ncbi:TPA: hypothetical protein DD449_04795 [Candidatus Berkelbacteria bacterium]|uniref:DUF304 domain-containing protein n=1 Tax=Berkelbacteria bacterium GW2011_GWE1_39_12 TaxID=1618337 RepID=A0A0G4B5U2_9BACT|nr:MAG: hypothetical protein UT28_C0001G0578 [Berkelbacteria bacterium GW2011_GWE1_39_12]HBO60973.1 hypothetical protein [Candidatus Berkelbacteria bacterium]